MDQIVYRVDGHDRISFVNSGWFVFAESNGMQLRSSAQVLGTRLWRHIADPTVRHLYGVLMARVRKTGKPVTFPFRCDSPTVLRFMEMQIRRREKMELEFTARLLREEARTTTVPPKTNRADKDPLLMMCVWCKNVKSTRWLKPERAVHVLNLFEKPSLPLISHVVCPRCESKGLAPIAS